MKRKTKTVIHRSLECVENLKDSKYKWLELLREFFKVARYRFDTQKQFCFKIINNKLEIKYTFQCGGQFLVSSKIPNKYK